MKFKIAYFYAGVCPRVGTYIECTALLKSACANASLYVTEDPSVAKRYKMKFCHFVVAQNYRNFKLLMLIITNVSVQLQFLISIKNSLKYSLL